MLAALYVSGLKPARKTEDFLVANRSIGLFALVCTLVMTELNTATLLAFSAAGYRAGPMAIALPLVFLIGLAWYTLTVARQWKRLNGLSVAELFTLRYGPGLGQTASLLLILAMMGFSATYIKSLTLVFQPWFPGLGPWILSGILSLLMALITLRGGLVAVVRSDIVSFVLTALILPALFLIGWHQAGGFAGLEGVFPSDQRIFDPVAQWNHPALPFWFVSSLIVLTMFTYICSPWYGQKIFAARDEKTAFRAVAISSVLVFLLYTIALWAATFFKKLHPDLADAQLAVPEMITRWLPSGARGVAFGVLFSIAMTTLTGVWNAIVAMLANDFSSRIKTSLRKQRGITLALAGTSWLAANVLIDDILNRLILANIPIAALSFALLAGFHWKKASRHGAWLSVGVGVSWGIGCFWYFGEAGGYTWYWGVLGIPLIFAAGIAGSLLKPGRKPA